ncbi:MAG: 30S ribosome-binding factor RbfA [Chloroflexota bacterium]|nr:30S ribosome-binding factor RbfA [Chloroflexota bacterium]
MVSQTRAKRIANRIHEELSTLMMVEIADPRIASAYITKVRVDRELAFASIYVSSLEGRELEAEIIEGMNHAKGFLRSELAHRVQLRYFPQLRFYWDPSPEHADRINALIASLDDEETNPM